MVCRWLLALFSFIQYNNIYCQHRNHNRSTVEPFYEIEQRIITNLKKSFNTQLAFETLVRNGGEVNVEVPRVLIRKISEKIDVASTYLTFYFSWTDETLPSWNDNGVHYVNLRNFAGLWTPFKDKISAENSPSQIVRIEKGKKVSFVLRHLPVHFECWADMDIRWPYELFHCGTGNKFDPVFPSLPGIKYRWSNGTRRQTVVGNDIIHFHNGDDLSSLITFVSVNDYQRFRFINYSISINAIHGEGYQCLLTIKRRRSHVYYADLICSAVYAVFTTCQYLIPVRKGYRLFMALLGLVIVTQNLEPLSVQSRSFPNGSALTTDLQLSLLMMQTFSLIWGLLAWYMQKTMKKASCKMRFCLPKTIFGGGRLTNQPIRRGNTGNEALIEDDELRYDSEFHAENTQPSESELEKDPCLWNHKDVIHCIDRFLFVTNAAVAVIFFHLWG